MFVKHFSFLLGWLLSAGWAVAAMDLSLPPVQDSLAQRVAQSILDGQYSQAGLYAQELRGQNPAAGCVLGAMVLVSRFDDLGDTTTLKKAAQELEACPADGLWEALRLFQLGFVHSLLGNPVKAAFKTRGAAKHFKQSPDPDAQAFYAIYAYYVDQMTAGISWMPFISDKRVEHLAALKQGANGTSIYWPLFSTSLVWIHYDRQEYTQGLARVNTMLARSPHNPVFLQIRADMLFMLKRYTEAAAIYEKSVAHYEKRSGHSIRYWSAVANLARIYQDMGQTSSMHIWKQKLQDPRFARIKPWLPESFVDDLEKRQLLPES